MVVQRNPSDGSSTPVEGLSNRLPGSVAKADIELGSASRSLANPETPKSGSSEPPPVVADGDPPGPDEPAPPRPEGEDEEERYISVTYFDILKHWSLMGYIGACYLALMPWRPLKARVLTCPKSWSWC